MKDSFSEKAGVWNKLGLVLIALLLFWHLFQSGLRFIQLCREMQWHTERGEYFQAEFANDRMKLRILLFICELFLLANIVSCILGYGWLPWGSS